MSETIKRQMTPEEARAIFDERIAREHESHGRGEETAEDRLLADAREGIGDRLDQSLEPAYDPHDKLPARPREDRRLIVRATDALTIWAEERKASGETRYGPEGFDNRSPLVGTSHEEQVCMLVEHTPGFASAYDALRRAWIEDLPPRRGDVPTLDAFTARLQDRIGTGWRSVPKSEPEDWSDIPAEAVPNTRYDR